MRSIRSRPRVTLIAACRRCGVRFGALPADVDDTLASFGAHERICPGGSRRREIAIPLGAVRQVRVVHRAG